ncbi:hypothetical protein [Pontibacillus yanchengensis]|nr:hypothetical protein [Pontibacillus yanchengensis]
MQLLEWHEDDSEVSPSDREEMQLLLNRALGRENANHSRVASKK